MKSYLFSLACCVAILGLVLFSGSFGDEHENFLAAWLLTKGMVPYRDFFFHHAPLQYFIGAPLFWLSQQPWYLFRLVVGIWFALTGVVTLFLVHKNIRAAVVLTWLLCALTAPLVHLNMFLAESWMALSLVSMVFVLSSYALYKTPHFFQTFVLWVVLSWISIWSSVVALPPFGLLLLALLAIGIKNGDLTLHRGSWRLTWDKLKYGVGIALLLHSIFILYFVLHRGLADAWWSIIDYNLRYYFPLRLVNQSSQAQWGYMGNLLLSFGRYLSEEGQNLVLTTLTFLRTMVGIVKISFTQPNQFTSLFQVAFSEWSQRFFLPEVVSLLGFIFVTLWLLWQRKWILAIGWVFFAMTLRGRENEMFKLSNFYLVIIAVVFLIMVVTWQKKARVWSGVASILLVCWCVAIWQPFSQQLTQQTPIFAPDFVHNVEQVRQNLPDSNETVYALGGNPAYYLLLRRVPAHKYFYYHPWFHNAPPIRDDVATFLRHNTTVPVVLQAATSHEPLDYAPELLSILQEKYTHTQLGIYLPHK